jgi:hypothetical protein
MFRRFTKKRIAVAVSAVAALALAAGAYAYFTASGSGAGSAQVGTTNSPNNWSVSVTGDSTDNLYPGGNTATMPYTITNSSPGHLGLRSVSVAVATDNTGDANNGDIETTAGDASTAVPGCLASWFSVDGQSGPSDSAPSLKYLGSTATPTFDVASNGVVSGTATLQLTDLTTTDQDPCQGHSPAVTVTAG